MIFRLLTETLRQLDTKIKEIRILHYPPNSEPGYMWEWISEVRRSIKIDENSEKDLKQIEKHVREAQRIYEKIGNEYRDIRLEIQLALIASYLRFLFPFSKFLTSLVKEAKNRAKEVDNLGSIWYNHAKLLEDEIAAEKENFTKTYL